MTADPSGRAVQGVGLRPLACCDCGFEPHREHGCLSLVDCCVLSGRGLCVRGVQRSPTERGVSEIYHEASTMRRPWPPAAAIKKSS
jgi:hypothetical protein